MGFSGRVKGGIVVLDDPIALPEGTRVRVELESRRTLAERFRDVIGIAADLPEDLAKNHDHYLHGKPKT